MGVPGPGLAEWAATLLAWAVLVGLLGEVLRGLSARWVGSWRQLEPIERGLVDLYLGGAVLYLVAAVPWGLFSGALVVGLLVAAPIVLLVLVIETVRREGNNARLLAIFRPFRRPVYIAAVVSALVLFLLELSVAAPVGTGNTFDSSLLTTYSSLLLQSHTIPLSFQPYASTGILYPQGTTVWMAASQTVLGLPPARTPLLVTPLFLGLAPLGGFVFGRRMTGSDRAGLAVALVLAWVGTGTREVVFGSNDFVLAFPLVLLLAGQAREWLRPTPPKAADALAFGLLCGYSAALNPVGAEWLLAALPFAALLARPSVWGSFHRWVVPWLLAVGSAMLAVIPSIYVLALGRSSPGFVPGATAPTAGAPTGITEARFFGAIDPFLFGPGDTALSSVAVLRVELAVLIVAGLAIVLLVRRDSALGRYLEPLRPFLAAAAAVQVALLGVYWAASSGSAPLLWVVRLSSANELSTWLFTLYGILGALPLAIALERFVGWVRRIDAAPSTPAPADRRSPSANASAGRMVLPLVVVLVIAVPGVVLTPAELPQPLTNFYHDFGNVTAADFDLLGSASGLLPSGARVLVAPGSAGEFLPGYCSDLVLLYPMVPGWRTVNASYQRLVKDLPNATFGSPDVQALESLRVGYVVVTGNNTNLWWAFSPSPFLTYRGAFPVLFHEGDAYLFAFRPAGGPPGPPLP